MTRFATDADLPQLIEWARKFHAISGMACGFDADAVQAFMIAVMGNDDGALIVSDHGFIGGIISPAYCDPSWRIAVELSWWAERGGLALLSAFEAWAKSKNVQEIRMTSIASLDRANAILGRRGYVQTEISYSKVI